jgi:hypothetical protein
MDLLLRAGLGYPRPIAGDAGCHLNDQQRRGDVCNDRDAEAQCTRPHFSEPL